MVLTERRKRARSDVVSQTSKAENFNNLQDIQIEEHEGTAPAIKKEGFQIDDDDDDDQELLSGGGGFKNKKKSKSIAEQTELAKLEKRRKALEFAAGWSGSMKAEHFHSSLHFESTNPSVLEPHFA